MPHGQFATSGLPDAKAPDEAAIDNPASPGSQIWRCTLRNSPPAPDVIQAR